MKPIHLLLSKSSEKIKTCGSRFWGNPDLPLGHEYPSYIDMDGNQIEYQFVCQINLAELSSFDMSGKLPRKGMLSFFAKIDHYLGVDNDNFISGYISDTDDVRVLFFPEVGLPGENDNFEETVLVDDSNQPVNPTEYHIGFSLERPSDYCDEHAIMAEPTFREWENWDSPFEDWEILLQVDSFSGDDFNLNFMDFGVLDFLISPEDIADSRFDNVRAIVLSS